MSMMPITAALVLSSKVLLEQTHSCIQNLPVRIALEQTEASETEALLDRLERHRVDVVLIESSRLTLPLDEFVRRLKIMASAPAVFLLHTEPSPQLILEALRAGAAEYLYSPLQESLREAFENLSANRARTGAGNLGGLGKIYGFVSAKGGCGSTTIACHVATTVAKNLGKPVLLADMDFEAGLIRFIMKVKTAYSVCDAVSNLHRMDSNYWKALISSHPNQMDIIPAPEDVALKTAPAPDEIVHLLRFIRSTYPAAIIDFGRMLSPAALEGIHELETLFLVVTPELSTLDKAQKAIDMFQRNSGAHRVKALLNRIPERGTPDYKNFEAMLGRPAVSSFVSDFQGLYDSYSEGHLLDSGSRLGRELNAFSQSLVRQIKGEEEKVKSTKTEPAGGKKWFSFLQRSAAK